MITKLQTSPNKWSCLPTAFAMAVNTRVSFIIKWIGHDGSAIIRPDAEDESQKHLGFHIQELISYSWWLGFSVTPFEPLPRHRVDGYEDYLVQFEAGNDKRIFTVLNDNIGVLTGQTLPDGRQHAVCWNGYSGKIYNPNGSIQNIGDFAINTFWCIRPREDNIKL